MPLLCRPLVHLRDVLAGLHRPQVEHVERQQVGQHGGPEVHGTEALRLRVASLVDVYHFAAVGASPTLQGASNNKALAAGLVDEVLPARPDVGLGVQVIAASELSKQKNIILCKSFLLGVKNTHGGL